MTTGRINQVTIVRQGLATPADFTAGENFLVTVVRHGAAPSQPSPAGPVQRSGFRFPLLIPQEAVGGHLSEI